MSHIPVAVTKAAREAQSSTEDALSKGTFRGSPVTDLRLATDVNRNTVRALKAMGPSDFQAVREIGQGAFGKVCHPYSLHIIPQQFRAGASGDAPASSLAASHVQLRMPCRYTWCSLGQPASFTP